MESLFGIPAVHRREPSKAQASRLDGLPSGIRRNLFLNHRHALPNLHYSKKRTRLITGTPPDTLRRPLSATQKQKVPFRHTPGRNLSLGSWGVKAHIPGIRRGIREARRHWEVFLAFPAYTGTEPSKAQASGLDEPLPAYGGTSSLTIGTRYATFTAKKEVNRPNSGNPPNPARCAAR